MAEELETILTFLQNNKPATLLVTGLMASSFSYAIIQFDKHINPYITGIILYPLLKKLKPDLSLLEILKEEHEYQLRKYYGIGKT